MFFLDFLIAFFLGKWDLFMSKGDLSVLLKRVNSHRKRIGKKYNKYEQVYVKRSTKKHRKAVSKLDIKHAKLRRTLDSKIKRIRTADGRSPESRALREQEIESSTTITYGLFGKKLVLDEDKLKDLKSPHCEDANFLETGDADHSQLHKARCEDMWEIYLRQINKNSIHEEIEMSLTLTPRDPQFWDYEAIRSCPYGYQ